MPTRVALRQGLPRYYAYEMLFGTQFWGPFWTLWLFLHLDYFRATLIDAVYWVVILLVVMPAGAVADRYGRKKALLLGTGFFVAGSVSFGLAGSFLDFVLANGVWAVGAGFVSETGSAYLYDLLARANREGDYPRIRGRATLFSFLGNAAGAVAGGVIVHLGGGFRGAFLVYAIPAIGSLLLLLTLPEGTPSRDSWQGILGQIKSGLSKAKSDRDVLMIIVFQMIVEFVTWVMAFFRPLVIEDVVEGDYLFMGLIYAGFFGLAGLAGLAGGRLILRSGERAALGLTFLLVFPPFAILYALGGGPVATPFATLSIVVSQATFYVAWGLERPLFSTILNRRVRSEGRATLLAVFAFFSTVVVAIAEPVAGLAATEISVVMTLGILALATALPAGWIVLSLGAEKAKHSGKVPPIAH